VGTADSLEPGDSTTQHDIKLQADRATETVILKMHRWKDEDMQLTPV